MNQFKALLRKEWQTHWKNFLVPVWFCLGVYLIAFLGWILSLVKGGDMSFIQAGSGLTADMANSALWIGVTTTTALLGFVGIINSISLADNLINGGYKRKCEILHLSQPVSLLKILGTKYVFMTLGSILLLAALNLLNSLGLSLLAGYYTPAQFSFGFIAWLQISLELSLSLLFASSLYWFFAGVFTRSSFFMGALVIAAIQATTSILNYMAGLKIPSLAMYLAKLSTVTLNVGGEPSHSANLVMTVNHAIESRWDMIWNLDSLMKVLLSAIFFILAYFLIKRRELS